MADWQVGDLAVRIIADDRHPTFPVGTIVRVTEVWGWSGTDRYGLPYEGAVLAFDRVVSEGPDWTGFKASSFRKIQPATPAFTRMLKGIRPKVGA